MNKESTPLRATSAKSDLGDSFFQVTPIKFVESSKENGIEISPKNSVFHESKKKGEFVQMKTTFLQTIKGSNLIGRTYDGHVSEDEKIALSRYGCKRKYEVNEEVNLLKDQNQIKSVNKRLHIKETNSLDKDGHCDMNMDTSGLFDICFDQYFKNTQKKSDERFSDKFKDTSESKESKSKDFTDYSELPGSLIKEFLDTSSIKCNSSVSRSHEMQNSSIDNIFHNVELPTSKLINVLNESMDKNNIQNGSNLNKVSNLLNESNINSWNDESVLSNKLSDQFQLKLLENMNAVNLSKNKNSGWSQVNLNVSLSLENSQYHELGPFFGLPSKVMKLLSDERGIQELYPWQKECLNLHAIKQRKNLVYALPTSGGKTLVAEILILREILCYRRNVLLVLPFVAIVQEKVRSLSQLAISLGFLVEEYAAGKGAIPPQKRRRRNSVLVATIEKGLAVINSLLEANRLSEFGLVVVDELHLISEGSGRGATLEVLLTQILFSKEKPQIIGMTATIGNLNEIASFLKAETYSGTFRPIELFEYVKCENKIYSICWDSVDVFKQQRTLNSTTPAIDPDGIGQLVQEVVPEDSVLIFCPTKKNCENVALLLCQVMSPDLAQHKREKKLSFFRALSAESNNQVCPILKKTIPFGVAYHHSGLTADERKLLEEGFRDGTICVICCTSTLAAGVNLPARRVILRSPYIGKDIISIGKYKQMVGRAGRAGLGATGESYLICQLSDCERVGKILRSSMDESVSRMGLENSKSMILSAIGLGVATTRSELRRLMQNTLLSIQAEKLKSDVKKLTDLSITSLFKQGALKIKSNEPYEKESSKLDLSLAKSEKEGKRVLKLTNNSELTISRLGKAAMKGIMNLEQAHELYSDLTKAQSNLDLVTNLHLLYLVTPYDMLEVITVNHSIFFNMYMGLSPEETHTAKVIGITEFVISKLATGVKPKNLSTIVLSRFYMALMLNELWKQQTVWEVAARFQVPRGQLQVLMSSASTFASNVLRFCEELEELWCFKALFQEFAPRLTHCCTAELLPLMDLPAVKKGRAKQLYKAGFKTLQLLAIASSKDLVANVDHLSTKIADQIIAAAKMILLEKAENLKEEAEEVLEGLREKVLPKEN